MLCVNSLLSSSSSGCLPLLNIAIVCSSELSIPFFFLPYYAKCSKEVTKGLSVLVCILECSEFNAVPASITNHVDSELSFEFFIILRVRHANVGFKIWSGKTLQQCWLAVYYRDGFLFLLYLFYYWLLDLVLFLINELPKCCVQISKSSSGHFPILEGYHVCMAIPREICEHSDGESRAIIFKSPVKELSYVYKSGSTNGVQNPI